MKRLSNASERGYASRKIGHMSNKAQVADIVKQVTDDKSLASDERYHDSPIGCATTLLSSAFSKKAQIVHAAHATPEAKLIKACAESFTTNMYISREAITSLLLSLSLSLSLYIFNLSLIPLSLACG